MTSTNFKSLFTKIDKPLKQVKATGNDCLVLIDNLNILMNGCYNRNELEFVEVLNELIAISENPKVKVALGVNRDLFDEGEIEWYRDFKNSAFDQVFEVSRNLSGYSKDVHSQLNLIANSSNGSQSVKNVKFRLSENKVDVFEHFVL